MILNFTVAWFEDDDGWYGKPYEKIYELIRSFNFNPDIIRFYNANPNVIKDKLDDKTVDLILADYDLGNKDITGANAIQTLRDKQVFADALFYSTIGVEELKEKMKSNILEGAYCAYRNSPVFFELIEKLIQKTVKQTESPLYIRGLLMDSVSEFDTKLKEALQKYLSVINDNTEKVSAINKYAYENIIEQININKNKSDDLYKKENNSSFIIEALDSLLMDSNKLSRIINKIFKTDFPSVESMKNFHSNYESKILSERNNLAHAKKEPEASGAFYFERKDGESITYDSEKCSEIRANINTYEKLISDILNYIR